MLKVNSMCHLIYKLNKHTKSLDNQLEQFLGVSDRWV